MAHGRFDARKVPVAVKGCRWRFWHRSGAVGINDRLVVYEADMPVGGVADLSSKSRAALANYMIALWTKFRDAK